MDETEEPYRAGYSPKTDLKAVNALMKRNKYFRGDRATAYTYYKLHKNRRR